MSTHYIYDRIPEKGGIRLINLHPAESDPTEVKCDLVHTTLGHHSRSLHEHYTALSYFWGDTKATKTIEIDGKTLAITSSLYSALRHIRDPKYPLLLWADGVCINQQDNEEKSHQVSQMGAVYKTASHTIIYLSDTIPSLEKFFITAEQQNGALRRIPLTMKTFLQFCPSHGL